MTTSPTIGAIAAALAKAQSAFRNPARNREVQVRMKAGGTYTFRYATLDAILEQVRPILGANDLCIVQTTAEDAKGPVVTTTLLHASGEWLSSDTPAFVTDGGAQAYGSAISYARRYAVVAMLALAADEDDDGNAAAGNAATARDRKPRTPAAPVAVEPLTPAVQAAIVGAVTDWLALAEAAVTKDAVRDLYAEARKHGADKATLDAIAECGRSKAQPPASAPQTAPVPSQPVRADSAPPEAQEAPPVHAMDPDAVQKARDWLCSPLCHTMPGFEDESLAQLDDLDDLSVLDLYATLRKRATRAQVKALTAAARKAGLTPAQHRERLGVASRKWLTRDQASVEIDRLTAVRDGPDPDLPPFHEGGQS